MVGPKFTLLYVVTKVRPGATIVNDHGDEVTTAETTEEVAAAGWAEPSDVDRSTFTAPAHYEYALDLYADAGHIVVGDDVDVDGTRYKAIGRANFDHGPFGWAPGLDVIKLGRSTG